MLTIRLIRTGKKNAPSYRIVLIEKTAPPQSGKFLEVLGNYNPRLKEINLKKERIEYWLGQGVKTSETVHNLLVEQEVIKAPKIKKKIKSKKKTASEKEEVVKPTKEEVTEEKEEAEASQPVEEKAKEESKKEKKEEPQEETKEQTPQPEKEEPKKEEAALDKSEKKE
jgi:ribosomal protein S16